METYFIGVDVGSASVRAGLYSMTGERLAFSTRSIQQFHGDAQHVEQSSDEIWRAVCAATGEAVCQSGIDSRQIKGLGFDATCSLVMLDKQGAALSVSRSGDPRRNIVMWMDHRATQEAADINATGDHALQYVGGAVSVEMELPKILWLKRHLPQQYQRCGRLWDLADFLVWRATGEDAASVCTLTCKWNYLAHEHCFSDSLLAAVGLDDLSARIPSRILAPGEKVGVLSAQAASELGLPAGLVVASGIIDAHAGGLALVAAQPENSLALIGGTSNCHMIVSREMRKVPGVWGPYWNAMLPGWWLNEGGQSAAGSLVEWTLHQHQYWTQVQRQAEQQGISPWQLLNQWVDDLERRHPWPTQYFHVLGDHHGNRSPRANPQARGSVMGLTLEQGRDGLARLYLATLQAVALGTRHIIETLAASGHQIDRLVLCGGVTRNPLWLREYANATGRTLQLMDDDDAVTLGAALMGVVASGACRDFQQAARQMVKPGRTVSADSSQRAFFDAKYQVYLQMYDDQQRAMAMMRDVGH